MTSKGIICIYVAWRKSQGERRHIVGVIKKNVTNGVRFKYLITRKEADDICFVPYADFPDLTKEYNNNVLDIFAQRLTKPERPDIQKYYDFWEITKANRTDKYYILAQTQGMLATDNFEFLAQYNPVRNLSFVTEVCGLSHYNIPAKTLKVGDLLRWELEPDNQYDKYAVKVYKDDLFLGYVKMVHNRVFHSDMSVCLRLSVKSIEENGILHRVFLKVYK